jgi:hypothetical protein
VTTSEADGSIYVTGQHQYCHTRKTTSDYDCFIMKLDGQANRIFTKSFGFETGNPLKSIKCMAIEITRNADYIFLGGTIDNKMLFFSKASATLDTMIFTSVLPTTSGGVPSLRRMIIEKNVTL